MMKRINASVDLHEATSHVFRHTIGTMLNDTGADVKTIQSILGQSDFKTTMDRYVHPRDTKSRKPSKTSPCCFKVEVGFTSFCADFVRKSMNSDFDEIAVKREMPVFRIKRTKKTERPS